MGSFMIYNEQDRWIYPNGYNMHVISYTAQKL